MYVCKYLSFVHPTRPRHNTETCDRKVNINYYIQSSRMKSTSTKTKRIRHRRRLSETVFLLGISFGKYLAPPEENL